MFEYLRKVLSPERDEQVSQEIETSSTKSTSKKYQVATAALLVEVAKADGNFSEDERKRIIDLMKNDFDLDDECVNELLALSEQKVKDSVSIYEFSSVINESFTQQEKLDLIKNLWRIIYEDGKLDSHEDRLIKIIGSTMNIDHKDIIAAKLFVKQEIGEINEQSSEVWNVNYGINLEGLSTLIFQLTLNHRDYFSTRWFNFGSEPVYNFSFLRNNKFFKIPLHVTFFSNRIINQPFVKR